MFILYLIVIILVINVAILWNKIDRLSKRQIIGVSESGSRVACRMMDKEWESYHIKQFDHDYEVAKNGIDFYV